MRYVTYKMINHLTLTMYTEQTMEDRLWEYIDGVSGPEERSIIDELLATSREWQQKYKELLNVHQLLEASELDAPSMRFTVNVMEEIARHHVAPATRGIGAFFLTLILGFVAYVLSQFSWTSTKSDSSTFVPKNPGLGLEKLNNVDLSKAFNTTYISLFMLISVVMGFVLLDMYLQRKKRQSA
jgi:hypothetical protein